MTTRSRACSRSARVVLARARRPSRADDRSGRRHPARRRLRSAPRRRRCRSTSRSATRPARTVTLGDYFGDKPVLLVLAYYECPMLCTLVLNGVVSALRALPFDVGQRVHGRHRELRPARDPRAGGREEGDATSSEYRRPGAEAGWHFLTGDDASIAAAHGGDRLPLRLGRREREAVRARQRRSWC